MTICFLKSFLISKLLKDLTLTKLTRRFNLRQEAQYFKMNYMNVVLRAGRNFGDDLNETIQHLAHDKTEVQTPYMTFTGNIMNM